MAHHVEWTDRIRNEAKMCLKKATLFDHARTHGRFQTRIPGKTRENAVYGASFGGMRSGEMLNIQMLRRRKTSVSKH